MSSTCIVSRVADTLTITSFELWTRIGVPYEERSREQRILLSVQVELANGGAGTSDELKDTMDYEEITQEIRRLAKGERKTLEKLAEDIASAVLQHPHVARVTVTLRKFILPGTKEVSLTIVRP